MQLVADKALVKTRRIGGSLVVTLPKEVVDSMQIKEGDSLMVTVTKQKIDGFGSYRGIGKFTADDELKAHE